MFETERRSAISSSELGLYSDRADRYNRSKYGSVVRKFVIVVMAIVSVILAAIFIYDFASGASASSKVSQETKHIYILQNALKKPNFLSKKITTTFSPLKIESEELPSIEVQERYDKDVQELAFIDVPKEDEQKTKSFDINIPETRSQNLGNFKLRKKLLNSMEEDEGGEEIESKKVNNHALVYRVRQMYKHQNNEKEAFDESQPTPFHYQLRSPYPEAFKPSTFPQLTQYRYPHSSKNIQDIIKYLTNDPEGPKRGIKFSGVYVNPNKYDYYNPNIGEIMANSDRSEMSPDFERTRDETENSQFSMSHHNDPLFQYKPKHPAEVNLLAPANFRLSSGTMNRYHPYMEPYYQRPMPIKPPSSVEQYENTGGYSGNFGQRRKPKPFSVMLDIYPITELNEQPNNKISRPRPILNSEEYIDPRRPSAYYRGGRIHHNNFAASSQPIPVVAIPAGDSGNSDEDEKQQMIFHLNLYPRKKNKLSRNEILQRSEAMQPEEQESLLEKVMVPFNTITKQLTDHSAIEEAKFEENENTNDPTTLPLSKYEESFLEMNEKEDISNLNEKNFEVPGNHKQDEDDLSVVKKTNNSEIEEKPTKNNNLSFNIDDIENSQKFADGLVATD